MQHVIIRYSRSKSTRAFALRHGDVRCTHACPRFFSSVRNDEACTHRCPRCCDTRGLTPPGPLRNSSLRAGSLSGSPVRCAYPTFTIQDQEALTEHEQFWLDCSMPEETRVFASMLYLNNVAPEQVLSDAGCADYQDERAHIAIAEAAEDLLLEGYESTDDEDA